MIDNSAKGYVVPLFNTASRYSPKHNTALWKKVHVWILRHKRVRGSDAVRVRVTSPNKNQREEKRAPERTESPCA